MADKTPCPIPGVQQALEEMGTQIAQVSDVLDAFDASGNLVIDVAKVGTLQDASGNDVIDASGNAAFTTVSLGGTALTGDADELNTLTDLVDASGNVDGDTIQFHDASGNAYTLDVDASGNPTFTLVS